jgi:hypothetical protein
MGISMGFEILRHFLFKRRITMYGYDLYTVRCSLTEETRIGGISKVLEMLGRYLFKGDGATLYGHDLHVI